MSAQIVSILAHNFESDEDRFRPLLGEKKGSEQLISCHFSLDSNTITFYDGQVTYEIREAETLAKWEKFFDALFSKNKIVVDEIKTARHHFVSKWIKIEKHLRNFHEIKRLTEVFHGGHEIPTPEARTAYWIYHQYLGFYEDASQLLGVEAYDNTIGLEIIMEDTGMRVDNELGKKVEKEHASRLKASAELWKTKMGVPWKDTQSALNSVFKAKGWATFKNKGKLSFKSEHLPNTGAPEVVQKFIPYIRTLKNNLNFYKHLNNRPIIYPYIGMTKTGRFTTEKPNVLSLPKKSYPGSPRDCIIPHHKDFFFVSFDYEQAEYRLLVYLLGNPELINIVKNPMSDFHQYTANYCKISRDMAKTLNFGVIYGMQAESMAVALNCSIEDAKAYQKHIRGFLDIEESEWHEELMGIDPKKWTGLPLPKCEKYLRVNYAIQGGMADIVRRAMMRVPQEKYFYLYAMFHDQLIFAVDKTTHEDIIMENIKKTWKIMETRAFYSYYPMYVSTSWTYGAKRQSLDNGNFKKIPRSFLGG